MQNAPCHVIMRCIVGVGRELEEAKFGNASNSVICQGSNNNDDFVGEAPPPAPPLGNISIFETTASPVSLCLPFSIVALPFHYRYPRWYVF
jgi:hypothetical protein